MSDDTRDKTGPLSPRQMELLDLLAQGRTHAQVGEVLGMSRPMVSNMIASSILPKMGCRRTTEAVARYARSAGLRQAAWELREVRVLHPNGDPDEPVNRVLDALAEELEALARGQLPS